MYTEASVTVKVKRIYIQSVQTAGEWALVISLHIGMCK